MVKARSNPRIMCLAPSRSAGAFQLGCFLGQRLGHRLTLSPGTGGILEAMPLGPDAQLAIVSAAGTDPEVIRRAVCAAPCPVIVVPRLAEQTWAAPRRATRRAQRVLLCGSDDSPGSEIATAFAKRIARACSLRVVPVTVPDTRPTVAGLLERAEQERALMTAVGSDCVDPDEFVLGTSVTGALVAQASRPVMIVPPWTRLLAPGPSATPALSGPQPVRRGMPRPAWTAAAAQNTAG